MDMERVAARAAREHSAYAVLDLDGLDHRLTDAAGATFAELEPAASASLTRADLLDPR